MTCASKECRNERVSYSSYCRACINVRKRTYANAHPDKVKKWKADFTERNPDYRRDHHLANKAVANEQSRRWHRENRMASRRNDIIGRARRFGHDEHFTLDELIRFCDEHAVCEDCGSSERLTIGHMIPLMYPSSNNTLGNLIRQCRSCNDRQSFLLHPRVFTPELAALYRFWDTSEAIENGNTVHPGTEERAP